MEKGATQLQVTGSRFSFKILIWRLWLILLNAVAGKDLKAKYNAYVVDSLQNG